MNRSLTTATFAFAVLAIATAGVMASVQRGNSNTASVELSVLHHDDFGQTGRVVQYRLCPDEDGMVKFTLHADGLVPREAHEVRSGGNVLVSGVTNPQGRLRVVGNVHVDELGARFNVWGPDPDLGGDHRLLTSPPHNVGVDCN